MGKNATMKNVAFQPATRHAGNDPRARFGPEGFVFKEDSMKSHLYEFFSKGNKLKCLCGWERTMKKADLPAVYKKFAEHCAQEAARV